MHARSWDACCYTMKAQRQHMHTLSKDAARADTSAHNHTYMHASVHARNLHTHANTRKHAHAHLGAHLCERVREIHRHRGLADPALAAGHSDDVAHAFQAPWPPRVRQQWLWWLARHRHCHVLHPGQLLRVRASACACMLLGSSSSGCGGCGWSCPATNLHKGQLLHMRARASACTQQQRLVVGSPQSRLHHASSHERDAHLRHPKTVLFNTAMAWVAR